MAIGAFMPVWLVIEPIGMLAGAALGVRWSDDIPRDPQLGSRPSGRRRLTPRTAAVRLPGIIKWSDGPPKRMPALLSQVVDLTDEAAVRQLLEDAGFGRVTTSYGAASAIPCGAWSTARWRAATSPSHPGREGHKSRPPRPLAPI
jgi:hypothetical protein